MISRINIAGNVGRDPDVKISQNNNKYVTLSVAVNSYSKHPSEEETQWFNLFFFDPQQVSIVERFVRKGSLIYVEGTPSFRAYIAQDGSPRVAADVRVSFFTFLNKKQFTPNQNNYSQSNYQNSNFQNNYQNNYQNPNYQNQANYQQNYQSNYPQNYPNQYLQNQENEEESYTSYQPQSYEPGNYQENERGNDDKEKGDDIPF